MTHNIRILFLSRLQKEKGVLETISALKILIDKGLKVKLTVAGDGSARGDAEKQVSKLGLNKNHVSFLGFVRAKDKIDTFSKHDIYCFPTSHGEGLPISVLEAMAFGMPVITTSAGGLKDVFQDGKMGFFTKSTTPEDIAEQLEKLILNPKLMQQIAEYNYRYAQEHFMSSKVASRITNIYKEIIYKYNDH